MKLAPHITLEINQQKIKEQPISYYQKKQLIRAILTLPQTQTTNTGVVFIHGWSGNRKGPQSILTKLARHTATLGTPTLRFDLRGRGESQGDGLNSNLISMAEDLKTSVQQLQQQTNTNKTILVGLCSGGNVAIGTLPQLTNIAGLFLLSVYPFSDGDKFSRDLNKTLHFAKQYWQKAKQPHTWKRVFSGDIHLKQIANVLFSHILHNNKKKETKNNKKQQPVQKFLNNLQANIPTTMIYGTADPETNAAYNYYKKYAIQNNLPINFITIQGANHNFSSQDWQNKIKKQLQKFIKSTNP